MNNEKLYLYENYREFLSDYFEEMKKKKKQFSFRYFAAKAGFKSPNFCYYLIKGYRNISNKSLPKLVKALDFSLKSQKYFEYMVMYTQSKENKDKMYYFDKMNDIRRTTEFYNLKGLDYKYLEHWYIPVVKELVVLNNWDNDYEKLGAMLYPPITKDEAQKAVDILLELNIVMFSEGVYISTKNNINSHNIPLFLLNSIKKKYIENSISAMLNLKKEERYLSGMSITMTKENYKKALEILKETEKSIIKLASDTNYDKIFQLNFQLYPLSNSIKGSN